MPDDREHRADGIERALFGILRLRDEEPAADEREGDDREVDQEHRAEPEVREQEAARRADRSRRRRRWWRPRSRSPWPVRPAGNTFTRIDSVDGMMNAAPTPISARQPMICHIVGRLRRDRRAARRRSRARTAARPCDRSGHRARRWRTAARRTRASRTATTHWSCDSVAPRSRDSEGSATLRLELPTKTMSRLRQRTTEHPPATVVGLLLVGGGNVNGGGCGTVVAMGTF